MSLCLLAIPCFYQLSELHHSAKPTRLKNTSEKIPLLFWSRLMSVCKKKVELEEKAKSIR